MSLIWDIVMITATLDSSNYTKGANKMLIVISARCTIAREDSVSFNGRSETTWGQRGFNVLICHTLILPGTTCTLPQVRPATLVDLLTDFRVAPFRARQRQLRV
jgi:hypothetical protein